ncbi:uncharacterized protein LOC111252138 isoform X1 [Varroa destructor]|uniref:Uncharacterized protein n=1 Tax=Varroa destructor TaxID=109461 RepID=A0A7M7KSV9_VARDE|nr:uncharacterized protein LOC111252138 isoform X1 [Varroa destructor]XP_022665373.1 uncharacterized protein LOC111252138 isoform X1 [Varroa destructor]XP_022665374.1 uncharacterized protein LOC111252138 isoform X1 [Varroa destructor]XP_022665376.1 uncharacterized protein LOC111252138 isoform X1 [Varroa destructor]XP_022665377.1 uncharacterized protein LOC111252138 isoform X1 [Varroa destructor]XP_022665378.1 uncharacterized protein LOC111252138 isoform X1 [Varroa destructor]XP_022665379.1 un
MATLGKDIDKKNIESYLTSPRRRSVVIDDERCVEIPIQMNPQLDASKLRSVAGRPPTPIPSDEENDDDDEQQQQQQNGAGNSSLLDATTEGKLGSGEHVSYEDKPETKHSEKELQGIGKETIAAIEAQAPPAKGSRH